MHLLYPLLVFNQFGDLERCVHRPGNVHSLNGFLHPSARMIDTV